MHNSTATPHPARIAKALSIFFHLTFQTISCMNFFFRSSQPKIYLGNVCAIPRKDFLRNFEGGFFGGEKWPANLLEELRALLAYPSISELITADGSELAVDVAIESYSRGGWAYYSGGGLLSIPLLWRPKIQLMAKLYSVKTGKQRQVIRVVQRSSWGNYSSAISNWKVYLGFSSATTDPMLSELLRGAAQQLKLKIAAAT